MRFILVVLSCMISAASFSQVTTSKIKGTVTDDKGEPLFGAYVTAYHLPSGTLSGTVVQESGRYTVTNLRVGGPYKVVVSYVGFKTFEVKDIFLTLGKTTVINAKLSEEGEALEEVVISSARSKTFNSDRTGAQTSVSAIQLKTLPTISRSASDFTRLEPTASNGSFGGRNDQFNNFSLDGSIFNNPFGLDAATPGGQTDSQPISLDAIEQISVSTAPYDVTLSGFTGASVNAVTKSGTNEFKGTAYGFYRNQDLTSGRINGEDVIKPKLSQNQFGISIGGPIVEDELFFFVNVEKDTREDLGTHGWIPNNGDGTTAVNESSVLETDLIAVRNALSNLGYDTGDYTGFTFGAESTKAIFKLDWNINKNHRLALIYNFLRASKEKPAHPTALGLRGPNASTLQFRNSGYEINNHLDSFLLEVNSTFNESTTNKFQVGYTHFNDFRNPFSTPAPVITIQNGSGSNYIVAGHEPFSIHNRLDQGVLQATNNMNFFKGDHTFTVGFSFEKFMFENSFNLAAYDRFAAGYRGTFAPYANVAEFLTDAQTPNGFLAQNFALAQANFNARNSVAVGADGGWKLAELNVGQMAFYVQDEWEVNDAFKVTYGIRFDKPLFFNTSSLIQKYIDTDNGASRNNNELYYNPNSQQEVTLNSTKMPTREWLISPRLGFNWDVNDESKLQIRGGTGVFTGRLPFVWIGNQVSGADDAFFQLVDPDFKFPQVWRSNLGADYRFENGLVLTADVAYTKDINGAHVQNWGLRNPTNNLTGVDNRQYYTNRGNNAYVFTNSDKGRVFNTSFKVEKSFENGLYANLAYSYLNAKDVNSIEAEITGDAFNFNPVVGNANNDVLTYSKYGDTHRIIGVASKKFTYGKGGRFATSIATFFEYAKGGRFNYTYGGDINNDGSGVNDLLYVPTASELTQMNFTTPAQATAYESYIQQDEYLSSRRGQYVERYGALAPWRSRWDVKFLQDYNFKVGRKKHHTVQLSVDILNVGNLINSEWGVVQQPNNLQPVGVSFPDDGNGNADYTQAPTYSFDTNLKETFSADSSLLSRWQMQVGLRYIF